VNPPRPFRIATYNVEWFDHLFDDEGHLQADSRWSGRQDVTRADQIAALGTVFRALDADLVMVIEAPDQNRRRSTVRALEGFARRFGLRTSQAILGFPTESQQEIAALYDPARMTLRHDSRGAAVGKHGARGAPRFDGAIRIDLDGDGQDDVVTWSKPPLELALRTARGTRARMIGVHAKSKAPHGADSPEEVRKLSIANRRKQLAQCLWLRARVDQHFDLGENLIVLGDFNDGPGLDEYEALFGRSGVEVVMGDGPADRRLIEPHADTRRTAAPVSSSRFRLPDGSWLNALLDYIMLSPGLAARGAHWRIWNPFEDGATCESPELCAALVTASDHFPVTVDLDI
jgi:hypothetical protein